MKNQELIFKLNQEHSLNLEEWEQLLSTYTKEDLEYATILAREIAVKVFGKKIYFRGIIEFSNFCKCDCYYCGIRKSNKECQRYRLLRFCRKKRSGSQMRAWAGRTPASRSW